MLDTKQKELLDWICQLEDDSCDICSYSHVRESDAMVEEIGYSRQRTRKQFDTNTRKGIEQWELK